MGSVLGAADVRDPVPQLLMDGLIEVRRYDQGEAMVLKSLFESEGIPAILRSRIAHSVHPFTVGAQGEVVIFVPKDHVARGA